MVIESEFSMLCDTTKTKCDQQEIPTYLQFSERSKMHIFLG